MIGSSSKLWRSSRNKGGDVRQTQLLRIDATTLNVEDRNHQADPVLCFQNLQMSNRKYLACAKEERK